MEAKMETYQEALDFVKEMLNATEPNMVKYFFSFCIFIDKILLDNTVK